MTPKLQPLRWGIMGTGNIAAQFARALAELPDHALAAVGSRSLEKARAFSDAFGATATAHPSYEALAQDAGVDVIYIATPHPQHAPNALTCLLCGKPALVEKPFTLNADEAKDIVLTAREKGLFVMEAMWTRFFPLMERLRAMVADGAIGEPRMIHADFGYRSDKGPEHRHLNPALGGGALLDVGCYPLSFASMLLGHPDRVTGMAHVGPTGVDEQAAIVLHHPGGRLACLSTAVTTLTPREAVVMGTEGQLRIHSPWFHPRVMTWSRPGVADEVIEVPFEGNGYRYEAEEVARCLRAGRTESAVMPLDESVALMRTMDTLRKSWKVRYPGEQ